MSSTGEPFGLFWNSDNGDRTYDASSFEYWLKKFFTSGVFAEELQVTASSGMTLEVSAGYANVDGKVKFWNAPFNVTLDAANSTYPRIDTVVIRRDNVNREIVCEKVTGGYSGDDPVPTAPVRNSEIYELVIAQIYIAAGATEVTQSVITDTRPDLDLCGYITGTIENLDFSQLMAQFETYFEEYKASFEQTMSDWESAQELSYASWFNSIVNQYTSDKTEWDAWYADLRASLHMLPQDSAEYLQVEINELQETASGSIFNIDTIQPTLIGQAVTVASEDGTEVKTATFEAYRNRLENTGESQTINGITYTVMANGTVVANGTASAESRFYINEEFTATAGQKLSGCPADGSAVTYQLRVGTSTDDTAVGIDVGSGYTLSAGTYKISINIASGRTVNNLVFSPMVRDASDTNEDYEEYSEYVAHARIVGVTYVGDLTVQSTDSLQTATLVADVPYFARYHVVLAFWQATVNIQGDTNLYGATITVKDSSDVTVGSVTLSAMDGTGTFYAAYPDTYTFNYTFSGTDYSEELVVDEEITYSLELSAGFAWRVWVDTASQLDSSDYDSLDEVLEDEKALRELFLEHACVDYMAESTASNADLETIINNDLCAKRINLSDYALDYLYANEVIADLMDEADKYFYGEWVITDSTTTPPTWGPKGNVPVMTSNTAPYGNVLANSRNNNRPEWYSFRQISGDGWASANNVTTTGYIGYQFVNPVKVKRFLLQNPISTVTAAPKTFQLRYSDDGTNWTVVQSYTSTDNTANKYNYYDVTEDVGYHLMWTVLITSIWNSSASVFTFVGELQFYGRELKVSVPTMTSNTAPYGEVSDVINLTDAYRVFDNNASTNCQGIQASTQAGAANSWFCYDFKKLVDIRMFSVYTSISSSVYRSGTNYKVQASVDNITYNDLTDWISLPNSVASVGTLTDEVGKYRYYRVIFSQGNVYYNSKYYIEVAEINFYGLDYSEKEFEAGTTKKWLYDHGVELEEFNASKGSTTTSAAPTNDGKEIYLAALSGTNGQLSNFYTIGCDKDLSNYSALRAVLGTRLVAGGNTISIEFAIWNNGLPTGSYSSSDKLASKEIAIPLGTPYTDAFLDISSVNGSKAVSVGNYFYNGRAGSITELWLE